MNSFEGNENPGLYLMLNEYAELALDTNPALEATAQLTTQGQTPLTHNAGSALPKGATYEEWATYNRVPLDEESLTHFIRFGLAEAIDVMGSAATDLLQTAAADYFFGNHLRADSRNFVTIIGTMLTRMATEAHAGGVIMQVQFTKSGDTQPTLSGMQVRRDQFDGLSEAATMIVVGESQVLVGTVQQLNPLIEKANIASGILFGKGSRAQHLLVTPPKDLEAELRMIRESAVGIHPADQVDEVLDLIRLALVPVEPDTTPDPLRLERLAEFVLSMIEIDE